MASSLAAFGRGRTVGCAQFRVLVVLAAAGVTAAYLTGISGAGSAEAFFQAQLQEYTFATSIFDVWVRPGSACLADGVRAPHARSP